jgi:hypothetical protein
MTIEYLEARELIKKGFKIQAIRRQCGGDNFVSYYYIKGNKFIWEHQRVASSYVYGKDVYTENDIDKSIIEHIKDDEREYYAYEIK